MRNFLFFFTLISIFSSCNNKTLQLPQIAIKGRPAIQNHSQIWIFYKYNKEKIKAEINKNNTISTTNWIINCDKRLPLSEVIPVFQMVKAKRAKKSIHSSEGMKNYVSYSDTSTNQIALFSIDNIQYITLSKDEIVQLEKEKICDYIMEFSKNSININNNEYPIETWNKKVFDTLNPGCIQLKFDEKMTYQEYLTLRLQINSFLRKGLELENIEYIIK
jgi:hypothetical protein